MSVRVGPEDFDVSAEIAKLEAACGATPGAIVTFTGLVRGASPDGRALSAMTLEHYPGMTERELQRIEALAVTRFELLGVTIVHRTGHLKVGERIVLVATAAPHREHAFKGADFLMDYLKSEAPFWKKETFTDGSSTWVEAHARDEAAQSRWR